MKRMAVKGKRGLSHPVKDESGQATLMAVLAMLILGAIIITPILLFMSTGLKAGQVHERRTEEFYAADAGVNNAIWRLQYGKLKLPPGSPPAEFLLNISINNKTVDVTVENVSLSVGGKQTYKITSTATGDSGSSTTVEAYIAIYPIELFGNAITSIYDVTISPGNEIYGDVQYGEALNYSNTTSKIYGETNDDISDLIWPSASDFSSFYQLDVAGLSPFPSDTINLFKYPYDTLGPLYRQGDLTIKNTGTLVEWVNLTGTIYVTGNLVVLQGDCGINLNGHTIYVEGSINFQPNCTISGTGCIIAVGNVVFKPSMSSSGNDYVFVMSVNSGITFQPGGDFYGSLAGMAGDADVWLKPNCRLDWTGDVVDTGNLNFPGIAGVPKILSYTIK